MQPFVILFLMDIRIKATDYELTTETSRYLDERIAGIEKLLGDEAAQARCEIEVGRAAGHHKQSDYQYFAEINLTYPGGNTIHASNNAITVNAAIDDVKEEITHQLRREKAIHRRLLRRSGAALKHFMRFTD